MSVPPVVPVSSETEARRRASESPRTGRYHREGRDTERASARRVAPRTGTQRAKILARLQALGEYGSTDYENGQAFNMFRWVAGTRREELMVDGWPIMDSGKRRPTDTGSGAVVWVYREEQDANG